MASSCCVISLIDASAGDERMTNEEACQEDDEDQRSGPLPLGHVKTLEKNEKGGKMFNCEATASCHDVLQGFARLPFDHNNAVTRR